VDIDRKKNPDLANLKLITSTTNNEITYVEKKVIRDQRGAAFTSAAVALSITAEKDMQELTEMLKKKVLY